MNNDQPHYKNLLQNAQTHLLAMYKEKFKAEPDGSAIVEASFAARKAAEVELGYHLNHGRNS